MKKKNEIKVKKIRKNEMKIKRTCNIIINVKNLNVEWVNMALGGRECISSGEKRRKSRIRNDEMRN